MVDKARVFLSVFVCVCVWQMKYDPGSGSTSSGAKLENAEKGLI